MRRNVQALSALLVTAALLWMAGPSYAQEDARSAAQTDVGAEPADASDAQSRPALPTNAPLLRDAEGEERRLRRPPHLDDVVLRAPVQLRTSEGPVAASRRGLDEPWISPMVDWLRKDRHLYAQLMAPQKPLIERVVDEVRPISAGLILATLFLLLTIALRLLLRAEPLARRLRSPTGILVGYLALFATVVLAKLFWEDIYRVLYFLSLFILVLGAIQLLVVAVVDIFLGRYRKIETPVILRDIGMIVLYVVTVILVLGKAGVNLTSILTTSAVLTAIIGFALQETLSSIIAGLAIQVEKPFDVGEFVQFKEQTGQVLEINWRTTKILTAHRDVVVIPNNVITREPLINFSAPNRVHRRKVKLGLPYEVAPNTAKASILAALRNVDGVAHDPEPRVLVVEYADFSIVYRILFYIEEFGDREFIEDRVLTRIWYQLRRDGIKIPFPIQDINVHSVAADAEAERQTEELRRRRSALDSVPFFAPLSEEERDRLARGMRSESYAKSELVIRQGDGGDSFYLISEGQVQVRVGSPESPAGPSSGNVVATLTAGQFFGEMSLMTGERRSATVVALTDTRLYVVDRDAFQGIIASNQQLVTAIGEVLAERRAGLEARRSQLRDDATAASGDDQDSLIRKIRHFFRL